MARLDEEIRACEQALQRNPRDAEVLLRLSGLLLQKGDANAAAGCLVRVAHLYDEEGVVREAVALLQRASRIEPRRLDVLDDLAKHQAALGDTVDAVRTLEKLADAHARGEDPAALVGVLGRIRQLDPKWKPANRV